MSSSRPVGPPGPPGCLANLDNQGNLGFCSRFALGKGIANGFMEKKFDHQQLDFVQRDIVTAIVNTDKVEQNSLAVIWDKPWTLSF